MTKASNDPNDRFGVPDDLILQVIRAHAGIIRAGCYIPKRHEVATLDAELLRDILDEWWRESPTELIPTDEQVAEVLAILRARPDAHSPEIQQIIAEAPPSEGGE
jgi:hypothetical protein